MDEEAKVLQEIKELSKGLIDILVAVGKIEVEVKQLATIANKQDTMAQAVVRLESDLVTAFKQIADLKVQLSTLEALRESDRKGSKEDRKWLLGAATGVIALVWNILTKK